MDRPDTDAAALAPRLDQPPHAVEKQLRRLHRLGFAAPHDSEPGRYRAVDPTIALYLTAVHRDHALQHHLLTVNRITAALPALARATAADRRRRHRPDPPVTVLDPADAVAARVDLAATATGTVRQIITTPDPGTPLAPAVPRRVLYRRRLLDGDTTYQQARRAARDGDEVRVLPDPVLDLLAADDHGAIVRRGDTALLLHPSPLLDLALRYFDLAWDRAVPLGGEPTADTTWRIGDDDHVLLALLSAGLKDQAIARHLGIGLRTVVRRIGDLARALDAETRFQLGVQAKARGLV